MRRRYSFGVILVGKCSLLREGLARILRSAHFRVLASVRCADDLPISKIYPHQMLFLVIRTGDDFYATIEQVGTLKKCHPDGRLAVVADHYQPIELVSAFRAGATGYFVDDMSSDAFVKSIELVMMGETVFPPELLSFALESEANHSHEAALRDGNQAPLVTAEDAIAPQLSPREQSILRYLVKGESNKSIARKIDIAEATVKVHVKAILRKIRVHNRTQAAIWGMNSGSLASTEDTASLPLSGQSKRVLDPIEIIPEVKQTAELVPLAATQREPTLVEVSHLDHLVRKGAARLLE
jgi:DNA-binding NarL/FixJ family response regulator